MSVIGKTRLAASFGLFLSLAALVWQGIAWKMDRIPDHILPLVELLSGTAQSVPVAYEWTMRLGFFSLCGAIGSIFVLAATFIFKKLR